MALVPVLDSLDGVDEALHGLYNEVDGKFVLDLDIESAPTAHPAIAALENAFRKEQDKRKKNGKDLETTKAELDALKKKVEGLPDDFDAEEWRRLKDEADDADDPDDPDDPGKGKDKGKDADAKALSRQVTRLERDLGRTKEEHETAVADLTEERDKYKSAFERTMIKNTLTDALLKANIAKPYMEAAGALHIGDFKVVEDDGEFTVVVGDNDEKPHEYIAAWADTDEGKAFVDAARNSGGGANGSGGGASGYQINPWKNETLSRSEQARLIREDPDKAKRLAREVGVTIPDRYFQT